MGKVRQGALAILLALASVGLQAEEPGCESAVSDLIEAIVPYDPVAQLLRHGVDPRQLLFGAELNPGSLTLNVSGANGANGFITVGEEFDLAGNLQPIVENVRLDDQLKGSGVGQLLYLAAGRIYLDETGKLLRKSGLTTPDAERLWERLVLKGFAKLVPDILGTESAVLSREVLQGDIGQIALEFVNTRKQP